MIVPLFALANAGIAIDGELPRRARSPRRSRSASWSATSSASRSGSSARCLARHPPEPRPAAAAGRLGAPSRAAARSPASASRSSLLIADARVQRRRARGGEARRADRGARARRSLTWLVFRAIDAAAGSALRIRALARHRRADRRPRRSRSTPSATTSAARRTRRSRSSSTATSSAPTAARPSRSSASCSPTSATTALRLAPPAAERRPPARAARRRGRRGGRARRARSGRCTTCCSTTRTRSGRRDLIGYAERARPRPRALRRRPAQARGRRARRRGRRRRRPQRRLGHADLLRQRPPPPRRLRHRDAVPGGAHGARREIDREHYAYGLAPWLSGQGLRGGDEPKPRPYAAVSSARPLWRFWGRHRPLVLHER